MHIVIHLSLVYILKWLLTEMFKRHGRELFGDWEIFRWRPKKEASPKPMAKPPFSNLDLVNNCDSFPSAILHPQEHAEKLQTLYIFKHENITLGYIHPMVADVIHNRELTPNVWRFSGNVIRLDGNTDAELSVNMAKTLEHWKKKKQFKILKGWRNELFNVYAPKGEVLFQMERAATPLFGVLTTGVHLMAYERVEKYFGGIGFYVPRRALNKATYPGKLDNTVAGGVPVGYTPFDTIVKEAKEEANLPEHFVRQKVKCVGAISYILIRDKEAGGETGLFQPGIQICYELDLTGKRNIVPEPNDGEVAEFIMMELDEVMKTMKNGEWKPNSALVMLDFFIRHGILNTYNEPDYFEILARLHRSLEFPTP